MKNNRKGPFWTWQPGDQDGDRLADWKEITSRKPKESGYYSRLVLFCIGIMLLLALVGTYCLIQSKKQVTFEVLPKSD